MDAPNPDARPGSSLESHLAACLQPGPGGWEDFVAGSVCLVRAAVRRAIGASPGATGGLGGGSGGAGPDFLDVDDLVQDVYLRLVARDMHLLRRFDPERARLSTYLTLVARSVAIDAMRRRRLAAGSLGHAAQTVAAPPHDPADAADPADRLPPDVPLSILSDRQQLVVRLLFEDGRSVLEAAAILGVEAQTVRSAKHKALTRLRAHYEADAAAASAASPPDGDEPPP